MGKKGGTRPGSGRPSGSKNKKTLKKDWVETKAKEILTNELKDEWRGLIQIAIDKAKGVYAMKKIKSHGEVVEVKVYQEQPDTHMLEYLIDRVLGKPKERREIDNTNPLKSLILEILDTPEQLVNPDNKLPRKQTQVIKPKQSVAQSKIKVTAIRDKKPILTKEDWNQAMNSG